MSAKIINLADERKKRAKLAAWETFAAIVARDWKIYPWQKEMLSDFLQTRETPPVISRKDLSIENVGKYPMFIGADFGKKGDDKTAFVIVRDGNEVIGFGEYDEITPVDPKWFE